MHARLHDTTVDHRRGGKRQSVPEIAHTTATTHHPDYTALQIPPGIAGIVGITGGATPGGRRGVPAAAAGFIAASEGLAVFGRPSISMGEKVAAAKR